MSPYHRAPMMNIARPPRPTPIQEMCSMPRCSRSGRALSTPESAQRSSMRRNPVRSESARVQQVVYLNDLVAPGSDADGRDATTAQLLDRGDVVAGRRGQVLDGTRTRDV